MVLCRYLKILDWTGGFCVWGLQITEFHWTVGDPDYEERVKAALLSVFAHTEEGLDLDEEDDSNIGNWVVKCRNGEAVGEKIVLPLTYCTHRFDDDADETDLPYFYSGKPDPETTTTTALALVLSGRDGIAGAKSPQKDSPKKDPPQEDNKGKQPGKRRQRKKDQE